MLYTGDPNDVCAITFTPVEDISHPVGFDANHAFECESIIHWLTKVRCTNPLNGQKIGPVPISTVLHPLMVGEVLDVRDLEYTIEMISSAGNAIDSERGNQVQITCNFVIQQSNNYFFYLTPVLGNVAWTGWRRWYPIITTNSMAEENSDRSSVSDNAYFDSFIHAYFMGSYKHYRPSHHATLSSRTYNGSQLALLRLCILCKLPSEWLYCRRFYCHTLFCQSLHQCDFKESTIHF